jgi:hypothetical protein
VVGAITFLYVATAWLIGNLYPPLVVTLAISGFAIILACVPWTEFRRRVGWLTLAAALAVAITYAYLHDAIEIISNTSYPGSRVARGGDGVPFAAWISQFIPTLFLDGTRSLVGVEAAELGGAGSFLFLLLLVFLPFRTVRRELRGGIGRKLLMLSVPLVLMWIWMLVPLPSWAGMPLLFHLVQGRRMFVACGLLLSCIAAVLLSRFELQWSWSRWGLLCVICAIAWVVMHPEFRAPPFDALVDLAVVPIGLCIVLLSRVTSRLDTRTAAVATGILLNFVAFGTFYPLLCAESIFHRPNTGVTRTLDAIASRQPQRLLVVPGEPLSGAVLNGWGYFAASHAFLLPKPDYYRPYFAGLDDREFHELFFRQSIVRLEFIDKPESGGLGLRLPVDAFDADLAFQRVEIGRPDGDIAADGGRFSLATSGSTLELRGWARWSGLGEGRAIYVDTPLKIVDSRISFEVMNFAGEEIFRGFRLQLTLDSPWQEPDIALPLTVYMTDPVYGVRQLDSTSRAIAPKREKE